MASLHHQTGQRPGYKLRYRVGPRQRVLWLGNLAAKKARTVQRHVEELIAAAASGTRPEPATEAWAGTIDNKLRGRLAEHGLIVDHAIRDLPATVLAFMRHYIDGRTDWAKPENYRQSTDHLEAFRGRDVPIGDLTKGEAERWQRWMIHQKPG